MDLDISKYVDVPKSKLKKLKIDTSKVDTSKVGEYEMTVTYKEQVLTLKVKVTGTYAPVIEKPKKALKSKGRRRSIYRKNGTFRKRGIGLHTDF